MSGAASYSPKVTTIEDGASANRLILRITELDEKGEITGGPTSDQVQVLGIIGSPEGRSLGSPGDVRVRQDVPQIWQKITGERTRTGWQLVGAGGGGDVSIEVNGESLGEASTINFTGSVSVSVSGGTAVVSSGGRIALDFRDWTPTDLNTPGNTVTDPQGVTWQTPTVANNVVDFVPTTGIFATNASGLEATGVANTRMNAASRTAPQIFADLRTLCIAYGVNIDPRRPFYVICYVSSNNGAADQEHAGCAIWRPPNSVTSSPVLFGDPAMYNAGIGFINGSADNGFGSGGTGAAPIFFSRPGIVPAPNVACVPHNTGAEKDPMIGVFDSVNDAFPPGYDLRATAAIRDDTDAENDIVMDPWQGFRIAFYICAENLNNTFGAVIQRAEIVQ